MKSSEKSASRIVDGIVLVNKPQGLTSNALLQRVKRIFHAKKAGHTGSLDPLATGMLPICLGEATKFCQYLLDANKSYRVTGMLGVTTDTGDALGQVVSQVDPGPCSEDALMEVLDQFKGPIQQVPPMYSALKHQGKPLYKYARAGVTIERPPRDVCIYDLQLHAFDGKMIDLTVTCSKGTYIRSLIESIGNALGVGGHVTKLHRCYTAGFEQDSMVTLDELQGFAEAELMTRLLPMERAVYSLPILEVSAAEINDLRNGKHVSRESTACELTGCVRLHDAQGHFIGLGELPSRGCLVTKRLLAFNTLPEADLSLT